MTTPDLHGLLAGGPLGGLPLAVALAAAPSVTAQALAEDGEWLVEAVTSAGPQGTGATFPPGPLAGVPLAGVPFGTAVPSGLTTRRWSTHGWTGEPGDSTLPDTPFEPRVLVPLRYRRDLPLLPEDDRRVAAQYGAVELANADNGLAEILQHHTQAGWPVSIRRGPRERPRNAAYSRFSLVATGIGTGLRPDADTVRLELRDAGARLDRPLVTDTIAGTGGEGGPAELAGLTPPVTVGFKRAVPVTWWEPAHGIFRVGHRAIAGIELLTDRGAPIDLDTGVGTGGDCASYAALKAATINAGEYATYNGGGFGRVNFTLPDTELKATVRGDAGGTGGYVDTHAGIFALLAQDFLGWTGTLAVSGTVPTGTAGWHWPVGQAGIPGSQALSAIMGSIVGWYGIARGGVLTYGRIRLPEASAPDFTLTDGQVLDWPDGSAVRALPGRWRQRAAYRVLAQAWDQRELRSDVDPADIPALSQPWQVATPAYLSAIRQRFPEAIDADLLPTGFDDPTPAAEVASYGLALGRPRPLVRVLTDRRAYALDLNKVGRVEAARMPFPGQRWTVTAMDEDGDAIVLTLLGEPY